MGSTERERALAWIARRLEWERTLAGLRDDEAADEAHEVSRAA